MTRVTVGIVVAIRPRSSSVSPYTRGAPSSLSEPERGFTLRMMMFSAPRPRICSIAASLAPSPTASITITEATPRTTPRIVRAERSLVLPMFWMLKPSVSHDLRVKAITPRGSTVLSVLLVVRAPRALGQRPRAGIEEDPLTGLEPLLDLDQPPVVLADHDVAPLGALGSRHVGHVAAVHLGHRLERHEERVIDLRDEDPHLGRHPGLQPGVGDVPYTHDARVLLDAAQRPVADRVEERGDALHGPMEHLPGERIDADLRLEAAHDLLHDRFVHVHLDLQVPEIGKAEKLLLVVHRGAHLHPVVRFPRVHDDSVRGRAHRALIELAPEPIELRSLDLRRGLGRLEVRRDLDLLCDRAPLHAGELAAGLHGLGLQLDLVALPRELLEDAQLLPVASQVVPVPLDCLLLSPELLGGTESLLHELSVILDDGLGIL